MADWAAAQWVDATPTVGGSISVPVSDARTPIRLSLNNGTLIGTTTLVWPVTNVMDGQLVAISAKASISILANSVPGGAMQGGAIAILAGANGIYCFRQSNLTWYKFS